MPTHLRYYLKATYLTAEARRAFELGGQKALLLHDPIFGPEHLLFGLLQIEPNVTRIVGDRLPQIQAALETELTSKQGEVELDGMMVSATTERIVGAADHLIRPLKHTMLGSRSLFLALFGFEHCRACHILTDAGLTADGVQTAILEMDAATKVS